MSCTLPVGRFRRIDFPPCAAHGTESALQCLWTLYTSRPRCHRRALFKSGERSAVDRAECPLHSKMPFDRATFGRLGWGRYSSCRLAADLDTVLCCAVCHAMARSRVHGVGSWSDKSTNNKQISIPVLLACVSSDTQAADPKGRPVKSQIKFSQRFPSHGSIGTHKLRQQTSGITNPVALFPASCADQCKNKP